MEKYNGNKTINIGGSGKGVGNGTGGGLGSGGGFGKGQCHQDINQPGMEFCTTCLKVALKKFSS